MQTPIQLIVGLGNPGLEYEKTRHNAGVWFIDRLLEIANATITEEKKFFGLTSQVKLLDHTVHLLVPTTYMNLSGKSVGALARFYKIPPQAILVAHDEIDLPIGAVRLKLGGGHAGHKGIKDIIAQLGTNDFARLRIGVAQPEHRGDMVDYVLGRPSKTEKKQIDNALDRAVEVLPLILSGDLPAAMQALHTEAS